MKIKIAILLTILCFGLISGLKSPKLPATIPEYFDLARKNFNGDIAFKTTAFVAQFWRVAGNTGYNETIKSIASQLEEAGYVLTSDPKTDQRLNYRIEKRAMKQKTWEPVSASLTILGTNQQLLEYSSNRNMIYVNTTSTPSDGIVGEIVYINHEEEFTPEKIKGKIVFTEMSSHTVYQKYKALVDGGALGLISYNNPAYLQSEKNPTSIQFRSLPYSDTDVFWGIALSFMAKEKLKVALKNGKVTVKAAIKTNRYPSEELTIIANIKGSEMPDESFVFSAHIQEPGANDNASGVGVQLEIAVISGNLINANKLNLKRTLTFLWGDEIISTQRYIEEREKRNNKINWGISLDMVGENTSLTGGSFLIEKMPDPSAIWTRGNDKHSDWGGKVLTLEDMKPHYFNDLIIKIFKNQGEYANWKVNTNPFEGGSDHIPFLRANIPGLLLWHFTDQFYHTDNDRIDKVSQETLKNVSIGALVGACTLVNADIYTAQEVLKNTFSAAKRRLNNEFTLSKQSINEGNLLSEETQILTAWSKWYGEAMGSIEDLTPDPNKKLRFKISEAQVQLQSLTNSLIQDLEK